MQGISGSRKLVQGAYVSVYAEGLTKGVNGKSLPVPTAVEGV